MKEKFHLIRTFLGLRIGRYLIIGLSVYILELAVIFISQKWGASPVLAVSLSFWIGLLASFSLQKLITFGDKRTHRRILIPQLLAFSGLVLFNFIFTIGLTKLLVNVLPAYATRTLALGLTTLWNFYLYKTRIFRIEEPIID